MNIWWSTTFGVNNKTVYRFIMPISIFGSYRQTKGSYNHFWEIELTPTHKLLSIIYSNVSSTGSSKIINVCPCHLVSPESKAPFQYLTRLLVVRSREVSQPRNLYLKLSDRSEIWQAHRQHCCRCAWSNRYDNWNCQSRGFETSRDWNGAQKTMSGKTIEYSKSSPSKLISIFVHEPLPHICHFPIGCEHICYKWSAWT